MRGLDVPEEMKTPTFNPINNAEGEEDSGHTATKRGGGGVELDEETQWKIVKESGVLDKLSLSNSTTLQQDGKDMSSPAKKSRGATKLGKSENIPREFIPRDETIITWLTDAFFLALVLSILYVGFEYLVYHRFGMERDFTWHTIGYGQLSIWPCFFVLVLSTSHPKWAQWSILQAIYAIVGAISGSFVIQYSTSESETFGDMQQVPGLITLWVFCILKADLGPALISLLTTILFYHREYILSFAAPSSHKLEL